MVWIKSRNYSILQNKTKSVQQQDWRISFNIHGTSCPCPSVFDDDDDDDDDDDHDHDHDHELSSL